jgi:hypothetical protein
MAKQSSKPPPAPPMIFGWGATGSPDGRRRPLTSAQCAELRRKRAELNAKLWQMTRAERDWRR